MSHPQLTFRQSRFTTSTSLLSRRRNTTRQVTLKAQLKQLKDTGRYDCFKLQWHPIYEDKSMWPVPFHLFWDSDIAKWIEGACYFLEEAYDKDIDVAIQELVELIRGAQQEDGYLNLHYTVVEPTKRWSNLRDMHELYNAGHLIEAAVAHQQYYKNDLLVEPIKKYIALIRQKFGTGEGQLRGYPGHPEIELALLRFFSVTGHTESYELARYFLTERGNPNGGDKDGLNYYDWEAEQRGEGRYTRPDTYPDHKAHWYCQSHAPIREQTTVEGHSVRAMYLLTAVADLIHLSNGKSDLLNDADRSSWLQAVKTLWANMVEKKMYMTGGIGAIKQWEGFGIDYFLPQGTDDGGCYAETCASIAVMMLAERLLHLELDGHYGDVMELCLYNNVMSAMSICGNQFTYVNQLASSNTDKSLRQDWFWCACCPPNLTRLYGSLGGYLWDYGEGTENGQVEVNVHLYTSAEVTFKTESGGAITLRQKSNWPWEGNILFQLASEKPCQTTIRLRLPAWSAGSFKLTPTPEEKAWRVERDYLVLSPSYTSSNPSFVLDIHGFAPRYLSPHPYTNQRTLTLARGPIVYCVEDADNEWEANHFKDVAIKVGSPIVEEKRHDEATGEEYIALRTAGWSQPPPTPRNGAGLANPATERELVFIPYYFRSNREGKGQMRVGLANAGLVQGNIFPESQLTE